MAISMLKIRRPLGRLIFNMGITIPGKTVFLIETAPSGYEMMHTTWSSLEEVAYCFPRSSIKFQDHTEQNKITDFQTDIKDSSH